MRNVFLLILGLLFIVGCQIPQEKNEGLTTLESKIKRKDSIALSELNKEVESNQPKDTAETVFYSYEDYPEYPGGDAALLKFLKNHTIYPQSAIKDRIEGRVYVKFAIAKDGSVDEVEIARGIRQDLDMAALEVVRQMPDWKPGTINGKPAKVWYTVPVNYQLEDLEAGKIQAEKTTTIKIYPNPTSGRVTMEISEWMPDLNYTFYDGNGRIVKRGQMNSDSEIADLSGLDNGIYVVRFSSDSHKFVLSERVIKR